jgi:hypothetical protein
MSLHKYCTTRVIVNGGCADDCGCSEFSDFFDGISLEILPFLLERLYFTGRDRAGELLRHTLQRIRPCAISLVALTATCMAS